MDRHERDAGVHHGGRRRLRGLPQRLVLRRDQQHTGKRIIQNRLLLPCKNLNRQQHAATSTTTEIMPFSMVAAGLLGEEARVRPSVALGQGGHPPLRPRRADPALGPRRRDPPPRRRLLEALVQTE